MKRAPFRLACAALAACFCVAAVAGAVEADKAATADKAAATADKAVKEIDKPAAKGGNAKPAGSTPGPATAGNADSAGQPGAATSSVSKPDKGRKGARKTTKKRAAKKARKHRKKAASAARAKKKQEAKKAAASRPAAPAKRSPAAPGKAASGKSATPGKPRAIQTAKVAVPGETVIGVKAVKACHLQFLLPAAVAAHSPAVAVTDRPSGNVLTLKIVDVKAPGGGFLSGSKGLTVEGRLVEGSRVRGTFVAEQTSMAAVGSCGMLEKAVAELARDIGAWLEHPAMNSKLGKLR